MTGKGAQRRRVPAGAVPELDIIGKALKFRIVLASLKEQYRYSGILGQSGCQYAASRASADDIEVVTSYSSGEGPL